MDADSINFMFPDIRHLEITNVRRCHAALLRIVRYLDYICRKNNLKYWICGGGLMGAIVHNGWKPTSHDFDISIGVKDFYKLFQLIKANPLSGVNVEIVKNDLIKIKDRYAKYSKKYSKHSNDKGIFVDILASNVVDFGDKIIYECQMDNGVSQTFDRDVLFPLKEYDFEGIKLFGPGKGREFLDKFNVTKIRFNDYLDKIDYYNRLREDYNNHIEIEGVDFMDSGIRREKFLNKLLLFGNWVSEDFIGKFYEKFLDRKKRSDLGIFYTPHYIVDYIVRNTVGGWVKGKSVEEILKIKILDPSCGSGRFLVSSFNLLCKEIESRGVVLDREIKKRILGCLYGIDLDDKAIVLTRKNLAFSSGLGIWLENVRFGNALIDNVFTFNFDVIIGGPPYGAYFTRDQEEFLAKKFNLGDVGSAVLFSGLARNLVVSGGFVGMVVPKAFVNGRGWKLVRKEFLNGLLELVDCGRAWPEVKLEEIIFIYRNLYSHSYKVKKRKNKEFLFLQNISKRDCFVKEGLVI